MTSESDMSAHQQLGQLETDERYVISTHLTTGTNYIEAVQKLGEMRELLNRELNGTFETEDMELTREYNYGRSVGIYDNSVRDILNSDAPNTTS